MLEHRRKASLSGGDFGWLRAKHHFTVTADGNPAHGPLGALVVWNDDEIAPGSGFPLHGHQSMEIISYIREGAVSHQDTSGGVGRTEAGDVQVMSAGTGIRHEERNAGHTPLKIFQIWLLPRTRGGVPRWAAKPFPKHDRAGRLVTLASGFPGDDGAIAIGADARVLGAFLKPGNRVVHTLEAGSLAYLAPSRGTVTVNGERVETGDGVAIRDESEVMIEAQDDAEIVMVETR